MPSLAINVSAKGTYCPLAVNQSTVTVIFSAPDKVPDTVSPLKEGPEHANKRLISPKTPRNLNFIVSRFEKYNKCNDAQ